MTISYILALAPAIELNLILARNDIDSAYETSIMKTTYNAFENFEDISKNEYYFNKRINNLIMNKLLLTPELYKKKLIAFKKNNDIIRSVNRLITLLAHINNFILLNINCPNLYKATKELYDSIYQDLNNND